VTLSAGACTLVPTRELSLQTFIGACMMAMQRAKGKGKNSACATEAADFEQTGDAGAPSRTAGSVS
jgi:hypothetical protein